MYSTPIVENMGYLASFTFFFHIYAQSYCTINDNISAIVTPKDSVAEIDPRPQGDSLVDQLRPKRKIRGESNPDIIGVR